MRLFCWGADLCFSFGLLRWRLRKGAMSVFVGRGTTEIGSTETPIWEVEPNVSIPKTKNWEFSPGLTNKTSEALRAFS